MNPTLYIFDANVIIDIFERHYPVDVFPSVLHLVERVASQARMIVPRDVRDEIGDQTYSKWLDGLGVVFDFDDEVARVMLEVMAGVGKRMVDPRPKKGNSGADPIVLAYAMRFGACVLTSETSDKKRKWVKLPDACEECDVPCSNMVDFFRAEALKL